MDIHSDGKNVWLYAYNPNAPAALIFVAAFGAGTIGHTVELFRLKAPHLIAFIIGCLMETFGYYGRFWSSQQPKLINAFVLQDLLLPPAPVFLAATVYIMFARLVVALGAQQLCSISPRWLTKLFIFGDVICFIAQFAGAGLQIPGDENLRNAGRIVVVLGLVLQILLFSWFIGVTWAFYVRLSNRTWQIAYPWKRYIKMMFGASAAVLLRNVVRTIEYAQGPGGTVVSHEVFIYVFDALLMFFVVAGFLILHPIRLVRRLQKRKSADEEHKAGDLDEERLVQDAAHASVH